MRIKLLFVFFLLPAQYIHAAQPDSLKHWGASLQVQPARVLATDEYVRKWLKTRNSLSFDLGLQRATLPQDSSAFAADYNYPLFSAHLKYTHNEVRLHREADPAWGLLQPVDYESKLGDVVSLYASFQRPVWRHRQWMFDYTLSAGLAYAFSPYDHDNLDNEMIGTRLNIYFGLGFHLSYRFLPEWALQAGVDFFHHSNGALSRPNKGANYLGSTLTLVYQPSSTSHLPPSTFHLPPSFEKSLYLEPQIGIGAKTLNEDWQQTQFNTPPGHPDYRRKHFRVYTSYNASLSLMYRYARRWASGIAADVNYGTYASHVEDMDRQNGLNDRHSPWSFGISARHQTYYGNLSLRVAVGAYLYRHMGSNAKEVEKPYYETIGLHYTFPRLRSLTVGANVKAHLTKADYTELVVSLPIRLK